MDTPVLTLEDPVNYRAWLAKSREVLSIIEACCELGNFGLISFRLTYIVNPNLVKTNP